MLIYKLKEGCSKRAAFFFFSFEKGKIRVPEEHIAFSRLHNERERSGDMPRAPSERIIEAEKLFNDGMAMVEIAKKLGVSDGTVRSWKNRYGWGSKLKNNKRNVAKKKSKKGTTLQKRKKGGQPGNKNAKGGSGNPNPNPPPVMTKHGGYRPVFMDALDEDEQELLNVVPEDEELLLIEQIKLFSIRERRILKAINKYREQKGDTSNEDMVIARLEQELSTVQSKKTKAIETLSKIRLESEKLKGKSAGNDVVMVWGEKLLEQRRKKDADK